MHVSFNFPDNFDFFEQGLNIATFNLIYTFLHLLIIVRAIKVLWRTFMKLFLLRGLFEAYWTL